MGQPGGSPILLLIWCVCRGGLSFFIWEWVKDLFQEWLQGTSELRSRQGLWETRALM